jgi:hypothetical protein
VKTAAALLTILLGIVAAISTGLGGGSGPAPSPIYQLAEGDIVFLGTIGPQGEAIRQATGSPYTHCGVVFQLNGRLMVYEAVQPVRATTIEAFQARSLPGTFHARRPQTPPEAPALAKARHWAEAQLGRHYDSRFLWSNGALYCSELVWKAYAQAGVELCPTRRFHNYRLDAPAVKRVITQRYGSADTLPKDEPVVSPGDLAASALLVEVPRLKGNK